MQPISEVYNEDCIVGMKRYPDKYFDLAVVDPPYGINEANGRNATRISKKSRALPTTYSIKDWDKNKPKKEYFDELFRVSKHQIIWGGNYFTKYLPASMGWIFWDKDTTQTFFSDGELAFTSFNKGLKMFRYIYNGFRQGDSCQSQGKRIHPTQKPIALYDWILHHYSKPGDLILDTHLGSGSSRIAAHKAGLHFVGFEIDKEYFDAQEKRFKNFISQLTLF